MKRFILISFGFLGLAFYEMSGGAEFQPQSRQMASIPPAPAVEGIDIVKTAAAVPKQAAPVGAPAPKDGPTVTKVDFIDTTPPRNSLAIEQRVAGNLTTMNDAQAPGDSVEAQVIEASASTAEVPRITGGTFSSVDTPAIIPSLIDPDDGAMASAQAAQGDIRTVSGSRVNVRGGPGTGYGVVSRLTRGDEVRIVEEGVNGWVRLQAVNGTAEGWMADFLLTSG